MQKEEKQTIENMICAKCKNVIHRLDQYSEISDFVSGRFLKKVFVHKKCFMETMQIGQGFGQLMGNLNKITEDLLRR